MEFKYQLGQLVKHVTSSRFMAKPFVIISRWYFEEAGTDGAISKGYAYRVRNEFSSLIEWLEAEIRPLAETDKE